MRWQGSWRWLARLAARLTRAGRSWSSRIGGASYDNPEHTFFAYDGAIAADADMIECDLQLTADAVLVCMHDTTVDRTTGGAHHGRVDSYTLRELRAMDFGSWFNGRSPERARDEFVGAEVVPFQEQLECYLRLNPRLRFHVETKAPAEYGGAMEPALVAVLRRVDRRLRTSLASGGDPRTSPIVVQSFELDSLERMKQLAPGLPTAYLFSAPTDPGVLAGGLPEFVDVAAPTYAFLLAHPTFVALAHEQGHDVHTWTVDDPTVVDLLLDQGVDGIFTNRPDVLRARIDARGTGVPSAQRGNPVSFAPGCHGAAGTAHAMPHR